MSAHSRLGASLSPLGARPGCLANRGLLRNHGLRGSVGLLLSAGLLLVNTSGLAQGSEDVAKAKTYFNAGAAAYTAGQYPAAIQAFDQAYRFAPRPGILFSAAQAYRKQYFIDKNPQNLQQAIKNYRAYLAKVPEGGRRADSAQALAELEPIADRMATREPTEPGDPVAPAPTAMPSKTRLMVSSQTKGAVIELDAGKGRKAPLIAEVKPGRHKVRLTAPGYFPEEREVEAAEGGVVAVDVRLQPKPARLTLRAEDDAEVRVDGRPVGTTPLGAPIELPAGSHLVTITRTGRKPYSKEVDLARGERRTLDADLSVTGQRTASYIVLGTGLAGLATGGAFTFLALRQESKAQDIDSARQEGNVSRGDIAAYEDHVAKRDDFRLASAIAFGAGTVLTLSSVLLMTFDDPKLEALPNAQPRRRDDAAPELDAEPSMEISAAPFWSPGALGGAVGGRF